MDKTAGVVPFFRTPYNYDRDLASDESGLRCDDPSLAKQQFREEADINTIVERFNLTGQLPDNVRLPSYGDFLGVGDYHTAMLAVRAAAEDFMALPAALRARFGNDPAQFVDFCSDESNTEEARKLGLLKDGEVLPGAPPPDLVFDPKGAAPGDRSATAPLAPGEAPA